MEKYQKEYLTEILLLTKEEKDFIIGFLKKTIKDSVFHNRNSRKQKVLSILKRLEENTND